MLHKYNPPGEHREWHSVSMSLRLDAEINYLLEKAAWENGGAKQKIITRIIEGVLRDRELSRMLLMTINNRQG